MIRNCKNLLFKFKNSAPSSLCTIKRPRANFHKPGRCDSKPVYENWNNSKS